MNYFWNKVDTDKKNRKDKTRSKTDNLKTEVMLENKNDAWHSERTRCS
jgi:hypothetical protein